MDYRVRQKRTKRKYLHIGLLAVLLLGVIFAGFWFLPGGDQAQSKTTKSKKLSQPTTNPKLVVGRYLLNGTVTWARGVEREANKDYGQPFSMLDTFQRDQYDSWSTDFECPITNNNVPYETQKSNLIFNCRPEFLPAASKYFNIFDLANNHTDNQGSETGLAETRQHLNDAGVQYFGTFDPGDADNVCEVISLPVRIQKTDKSEQKSSLPVAFCGWHYFYRKPLAGEIAAMDKYAKVMPVFAFVEMGTEYQPKANDIQVEIAHQIVDRNPEFLIANNPHWVQNTEVYKNKLIVYSTGNFIFDQLDAETNRSASIDVGLTVPYDNNVAKWLALSPQCATFHDSCLEIAQKQGLSKINLQLKYGIVAGQNGYKVITHKADAATQTAVEERTNWAATLKALGQQ
jgi:hypothetical protein